jgi:hypothetical protein
VVVPKLVRGGHNSRFGLVTCLMSPFKVHALIPGLNVEIELLTIFNHFRNRHARYLIVVGHKGNSKITEFFLGSKVKELLTNQNAQC